MDSATREDLKRNELGEAIEGAIHYAEDHSKTILRAVGAVVALGLVAGAIAIWTTSRRSGANEMLVAAMKADAAEVVATDAKPDDAERPTFATEAARRARARELFGKLDASYGGTKVGRIAKLYLAQYALEDGDAARARAIWGDFLAGEDDTPMAAAARVNLWKLDRAEGQAQKVVDEVQRLLAGATKPMPDDVLLYELAQAQSALGQKTEAAATYRRIVDEFPQSPYASIAQREAGTAPSAVGTPGTSKAG